MAYTLVEAAKLSNDILQVGVVELLTKDDPILERLPFQDMVGNSLLYNEETTRPSVAFYEVGDTWVESTPTVTQASAVLRILGGDSDVDNFVIATRSNINEVRQIALAQKILAVREEFNDSFLYGSNATNSKRFDGMHYMLRNLTYNTITVAITTATPVALSLERAEAAKDLIKFGQPAIALMTKGLRRYINKYLNGVGGITKTDIQGRTVQTLFDVPIAVSDHLGDDESCDLDYGTNQFGHNHADGSHGADDDGATSIFFLQFHPMAACGLQQGQITVVDVGDLETKDAKRIRVKWYCSAMMQSRISCSKVTGIDWNGTVTA